MIVRRCCHYSSSRFLQSQGIGRFGHYNRSENRPFFKSLLSKCAQFSGRFVRKFFQFAVFLNRQAAVPIFRQLLLTIFTTPSFSFHTQPPDFGSRGNLLQLFCDFQMGNTVDLPAGGFDSPSSNFFQSSSAISPSPWGSLGIHCDFQMGLTGDLLMKRKCYRAHIVARWHHLLTIFSFKKISPGSISPWSWLGAYSLKLVER